MQQQKSLHSVNLVQNELQKLRYNQLIITGFVVSIQICALFQELRLKHAKKERKIKNLEHKKMLN